MVHCRGVDWWIKNFGSRSWVQFQAARCTLQQVTEFLVASVYSAENEYLAGESLYLSTYLSICHVLDIAARSVVSSARDYIDP